MKRLIIILIIMSSFVIGQISSFIPEERVVTLKNQMQKAGYHKIRWYGRNKTEKPLSSGMYIIYVNPESLESEEMFTQSQKLVLLK